MNRNRLHLLSPLQPMRRRRGRFRPRRILTLGALGLGLIGFTSFADPAPRLVWNASASAPIGLYLNMGARDVSRGDLVLARAPESAHRLAATRGYLPEDVPLVKQVAGLSGDTICAAGDTTWINGGTPTLRLRRDRHGLEMPTWTGCKLLNSDEIFLLMGDVPDSFDGRYFGPIATSMIIGRLVPLWTE